jgi:scyllo-inositol 2-dehydrogenase (NADP+)
MINVGLIGFGLAGRYFHAPLIVASGMQLRAVVTSRASEVEQSYPHSKVVSSVDALLARDDIDLVVVASPSSLHFEHARAALDARKHVVVDKPVSTSAAEVDVLIQLAQRQDCKLSVFQNRRWDGDFLTIAKLIEQHRLGTVSYFRMRWDRFRPGVVDRWRERAEPGSGMLFDLGSHLIDQALFLFGRPDWVQADVFAQREGAQTDDGFELLLGKGALRINLGVSSLAAGGDWRYVIHGSHASFFKAGLDPQEDQSRAGMDVTDPQFGVDATELHGKIVYGADGRSESVATERGRWLTYYESMQRAITSEAPVPVAAHEARAVLEIMEAARNSSAQGRRIAL